MGEKNQHDGDRLHLFVAVAGHVEASVVLWLGAMRLKLGLRRLNRVLVRSM